MPHLDNDRRESWDRLRRVVEQIQHSIDGELRSEWAISLSWFDVLNGLRTLGGRARPLDLADHLDLPASTLSRRLDRLEEEGWIKRHPEADASDLRAVDVELTATGRRLWREMNLSYRRLVQQRFASRLSDEQIRACLDLADLLSTDGGDA